MIYFVNQIEKLKLVLISICGIVFIEIDNDITKTLF